jgi:hypothetical protein
MVEEPGLSDQYRMASPWPLFVALGLTLSEVGIFLALFPIAVGGILLLGGSVAGILRESGYVSQPWGPLVYLGLALAAVGGLIVWTQVDPGVALLDIVNQPGGAVGRGLAIAVGGVMLVLAGGTGSVVGQTRV